MQHKHENSLFAAETRFFLFILKTLSWQIYYVRYFN